MPFIDRADAGRQLAAELGHLAAKDVVVLGLSRGGVPVADQVARALGAPLEVLVVRKLGVPFQPEWAMGAVSEDGVLVVNDDVVRAASVTQTQLAAEIRHQRAEVEAKASTFRDGRAPESLASRVAVLVDDGTATGATLLAACHVARARAARRVIVAVPVASRAALNRLRAAADEVIGLYQPGLFGSVGQWYRDFTQVNDTEVVTLLSRATSDAEPVAAGSTSGTRPSHTDTGCSR